MYTLTTCVVSIVMTYKDALRTYLFQMLYSLANYKVIRTKNYSRLSLSRDRRDPQKQFEISVPRHISFVVLRKKQFEQPIFTNDYVI